MAGSAWLLVPLLLLPLALGLVLLRRLGLPLRGCLLFTNGAAYGAGSFAVALALLLFGLLGIPMTPTTVLVAALGLGLLARLGGRGPEPHIAPPPSPHRPLERLACAASLCLCAASVVEHAVEGNLYAITTTDEATHYFAKSCEIYDLGGFGPRYVKALNDGVVAAPDYPLLNPLLQVHAHVWNGGVARVDARLPIQGFLLALVAVLGGALARFGRPWLAALLTPLVLMTDTGRVIGRSALADGLVAFGVLLATVGSLARRRGDERRAAPVFALGLALAIWSKNEGAMLALVLLLADAAAIWRSPTRRQAIAWLGLPLATALLHVGFNLAHGFRYYMLADYGGGAVLTRFLSQVSTHGSAVARTFAAELLWPATCTNGIFAALLLLVVLAPRRVRAAGCLAPALALAAGVAGFAVILTGTGTELRWSLQTATPRLWFQLAPAAALLIGATLATREGSPRKSAPGATERSR